jgi:hypothetical protein
MNEECRNPDEERRPPSPLDQALFFFRHSDFDIRHSMRSVPHPPPTFYTCPGERHAISRAVHQARLSRHYEACRGCPHRDDIGLVPLAVRAGLPAERPAGLVFTADGLRGRYLNDLTRRHARLWAAAFAAWLWSERTLIHQNEPATVAVGFDERPTSPDLALGVVTGLRQSGCRVIDIGQATPAVWRFATQHRQTDGGVFITGAGRDASWTGFDILGPGGLPLDPQTTFAPLIDGPPHRTPSAGAVETDSPWTEYEADLATGFHALRPLRVTAIVLSPLVERLLSRLFAPLPCQLTFAATTSVAGPPLRWEIAVDRLQTALRDQPADVGVLIGEDGRQFALVDETGTLIHADQWQPWLLESLTAEQPGMTMVARSSSLSEFVLQLPCAAGGIDPTGRFWHGGNHPTCDAVRTLATLLRTLSWSDAPVSERVAAVIQTS